MNIRIGTAPDSWGIWFADDPQQVPWPRFLDEVAEAGYEWIEPVEFRETDLDDAEAVNLDNDSLSGAADFAPRLSGSNPLRNSTDKELGKQIDGALARLTDEHRVIVLLREVEGMSYEEISETLGVPKGTVMSRLFHARKNLQRVLRPVLGIQEGIGLDGKPAEKGRNPPPSPVRSDPNNEGEHETAEKRRTKILTTPEVTGAEPQLKVSG